ncbi:hypothetical protein [Brevibacillus sp. NRS-1366]|uniref:hypothetical protein n=1 Tax=Brevibacillus sp. NRS-1366 TaxID=3233899 RepID=UPI003D1C4712
MRTYKLNKYSHWDEDDESVCFEHTDDDIVTKKALELCSKEKPYTYTYRMETWEDEKMIGSWRFFQDGREFTQDILNAVKR